MSPFLTGSRGQRGQQSRLWLEATRARGRLGRAPQGRLPRLHLLGLPVRPSSRVLPPLLQPLLLLPQVGSHVVKGGLVETTETDVHASHACAGGTETEARWDGDRGPAAGGSTRHGPDLPADPRHLLRGAPMTPVSGWPRQPDPGLASNNTPKPGHRRETRHKGCGSHARMSRPTGAPVLGTAGPCSQQPARKRGPRPSGLQGPGPCQQPLCAPGIRSHPRGSGASQNHTNSPVRSILAFTH